MRSRQEGSRSWIVPGKVQSPSTRESRQEKSFQTLPSQSVQWKIWTPMALADSPPSQHKTWWATDYRIRIVPWKEGPVMDRRGAWSWKDPCGPIDPSDVQFKPGSSFPVDLAVWNGSNIERNGMKGISIWFTAPKNTELAKYSNRKSIKPRAPWLKPGILLRQHYSGSDWALLFLRRSHLSWNFHFQIFCRIRWRFSSSAFSDQLLSDLKQPFFLPSIVILKLFTFSFLS